jgi:RAQPRD family integrative conjugative element protein
MYKQNFIPILFFCLCLAPSAHADVFAEKETLARLANEILALEPLVGEAEARKAPGSSVKFQYNALRADLAKTRQGIEAYINQSDYRPRKFKPLKGDYRR